MFLYSNTTLSGSRRHVWEEKVLVTNKLELMKTRKSDNKLLRDESYAVSKIAYNVEKIVLVLQVLPLANYIIV